MTTLGIRALKQNASAVVAQAASGETITITDRGRPVALLVPIPDSPVDRLAASGRVRETGRITRFPARDRLPAGSPSTTELIRAMRDAERY